MCALCFAAFDRAGYFTGDSQIGEPPDWCQYGVTPEGNWAALCFNPFSVIPAFSKKRESSKFHRCDSCNDGILRYSNNPNLAIIPAPDAIPA